MEYQVKSAEFSEDGKYRYQLTRIWNSDNKLVMCIGLNPSNANADKDDPTIRILTIALSSLGYGGLKMMNLYAFITSKPSELFNCPDPLGLNNEWLKTTAYGVQEIVFCWGAFKNIEYRVKQVRGMFPDGKCFGKSKDGSPWHPRALTYAGIKPSEAKLTDYDHRMQTRVL